MHKSFFVFAALALAVVSVGPGAVSGQDEGLPAIAREVYQPHTALPPSPAPRVVTERLVTEPPILPPRVVDDAAVVAPAVVAPAVVTPAVVTPGAAVIAPSTAVVPTAVVPTTASIFSRYTFGFFDDGNVDDNWFFDYYDVPRTAVAVQPAANAGPGFRTTWTYDRQGEAALFNR